MTTATNAWGHAIATADMEPAFTGTPVKLPDGQWGVKIDASPKAVTEAKPCVVEITAKSGKTWRAGVGQIQNKTGKSTKAKTYRIDGTSAGGGQPTTKPESKPRYAGVKVTAAMENAEAIRAQKAAADKEAAAARREAAKTQPATDAQREYIRRLADKVDLTDEDETSGEIHRYANDPALTKERASNLIERLKDDLGY